MALFTLQSSAGYTPEFTPEDYARAYLREQGVTEGIEALSVESLDNMYFIGLSFATQRQARAAQSKLPGASVMKSGFSYHVSVHVEMG